MFVGGLCSQWRIDTTAMKVKISSSLKTLEPKAKCNSRELWNNMQSVNP